MVTISPPGDLWLPRGDHPMGRLVPPDEAARLLVTDRPDQPTTGRPARAASTRSRGYSKSSRSPLR